MDNTDTTPASTVWPFTPAELERLVIYRAAVQAAYYSEAIAGVPLSTPVRQLVEPEGDG